MKKNPTFEHWRKRDGFILVAVLWILGGLAVLASVYSIYVINTAVSLNVNTDRIQAKALISASLELTAYHLGGGGNPNEPTSGTFDFRLGGANVAVRYLSEAARIDLNTAPKPLLAGLFASLGAGASNASYYADRIIGWRTKAPRAGLDSEAGMYRTAGLHYGPREAPFESVDELWLVLGLPPALVKSALPYVTVFSGQHGVDVFDAAPTVIAALPGMTSERLYAVLQQREAAPLNRQGMLNLLGAARSAISPKPGDAIRVNVLINLANGRQVHAQSVILLLKDAPEPYRILSWQDDFDGPIDGVGS